MARSSSDVRERLQTAAVELFRERGYDHVTAAEIAARVGVTERTFFRHFPDKREVLFAAGAVMADAFKASIAGAPDDMEPLAILFSAFRSVEPLLIEYRPFAEPRLEVISATPALQERELAKADSMSEELAVALKARGVPDLAATLAARMGMAAFAYASLEWLKDDSQGLVARLDQAERAMRELASS